MHEHRRLQPLGEIERLRRELEALGRVLGEQQHVLGVAVRSVGAREHVRLLGARRHAGRRPAALHVDQHDRDLGEIGEPDELAHQRDAGAGGRGERARAVPAGADRDADRGELVLALDDRVTCSCPSRDRRGSFWQCLMNASASDDEGVIGYHAHTVAPPYTAPSAAALLPSTKILLPTLFARLTRDAERAGEVLLRVVAAQPQRLHVRLQQRFLALVLLGEELLDLRRVDLEQRGERADVDDVLEELALARIAVGRVADLGERHADHVHVVAELRFRQRLRAVVEEIAAGLDLLQVAVPGLRVHRDHEVDAAAPAAVAGLVDAHLVPGRQALDVRREDVARARPARPCAGSRARKARSPTPSPSR